MEMVYMSDKTLNYIGLGLGILVTIFIVTFSDSWYWNSDGMFTIQLSHTMIYDWFKPVIDGAVLGILRTLILVIGFWLSFKFRGKIGNAVVNFHKKV